MARPTEDFLNQAIDELMAVLKASPYFLAPDAADAPAGARGVVMGLEDDLPETDQIEEYLLPHCSVVYLDDDPNEEDSTSSQTDLVITLGLRLYHRGPDRREVWRTLKKAAAIVNKIVRREMVSSGGQFNDFATLANYAGGTAIDTKEKNHQYGAMQLVRVMLQITRPDYEEDA
jgi:hypothetical protein